MQTGADSWMANKMIRNMITTQALITLTIVLLYAIDSLYLSYSAAFGGVIAMSNTLLHGLRLTRLQQVLAKDPKQDVLSIAIGAVQRFVFTIAMMIVGLSVLKLEPTSLLLTFGASYIAYFFVAARMR